MKHLGIQLLLAAVIAFAGACGDDTSTSTSATTTTTTTTGTTVVQSTTTTAAVTTSTTTEATTTLAADAHPTLGVSWASVWPAEDETATYLATAGSTTFEVEASIAYGVDYKGMTVDRLTFGTAEPGHEGAVVYFDRSEPWIFKVLAVESYSENLPDDVFVESFADPLTFDGNLGVGDTYDVESEISFEGPGPGQSMGVTYTMTPATLEDSVAVPFGTVEGLLRVDVTIGGEFMSFGEFTTSLWFDADLFLVRFDNPPEWERLELVSPWA